MSCGVGDMEKGITKKEKCERKERKRKDTGKLQLEG
jgi:hypothetical protein